MELKRFLRCCVAKAEETILFRSDDDDDDDAAAADDDKRDAINAAEAIVVLRCGAVVDAVALDRARAWSMDDACIASAFFPPPSWSRESLPFFPPSFFFFFPSERDRERV